MTKDQREIQRELRILKHAEDIGHVAKTCRYFGVGRASFYRWRKAYAERGEALEQDVLGALKAHLMDPELCAVFCAEFTKHMNKRHRLCCIPTWPGCIKSRWAS